MLVTWVDWVFVAVLALAVAAGFVRGLVREALGLASWIVALLAARMFAEPVAEVLGNWIDSPDGRLIVAFILIIVITILLGGILIRMIQAAVDESQKHVSGTVRLKLFKGSVTVVGRKSPVSLYSEQHVTFEADTVYDQRDAEGFIKLNALRLRLLNARKG